MKIIGNTPSNEEIPTVEKPVQKAVEKLAEYKFFYKDKFSNCKSINEVFDTYVKYTDYDEILNEYA